MVIAATQRLTLRHFQPGDVASLSLILADPKVMRFSLSGPKTIEQTQALVERCGTDYNKHGFSLYAVIHRQNQCLIGYCGLSFQTIDDRREIEIAYRLHTDDWGQGLGTEAAQSVVAHAANELHLERLVAIIEAANIGSIRVATRAGLHWERDTDWRGLPVRVYAIALPKTSAA